MSVEGVPVQGDGNEAGQQPHFEGGGVFFLILNCIFLGLLISDIENRESQVSGTYSVSEGSAQHCPRGLLAPKEQNPTPVP